MKRLISHTLLTLALLASAVLAGGFKYKPKVKHDGNNVTPSQAFEIMQQDSSRSIIIDVRTRAEYQLIGHPENAYNIPYKFWTGEFDEIKYSTEVNPNFQKDLLNRFNPETDKLIFICRSGKRSCLAVHQAIKAGWSAENVSNMLGGFEGDKIKDENSTFNGMRKLGGWRNEGLPWVFGIDKNLVYSADVLK
jgi:rhodanese-related sulfurtransferase